MSTTKITGNRQVFCVNFDRWLAAGKGSEIVTCGRVSFVFFCVEVLNAEGVFYSVSNQL